MAASSYHLVSRIESKLTMSKQPTMKRKILDMKDKLRIIEAFDEKVKTEGKVRPHSGALI